MRTYTSTHTHIYIYISTSIFLPEQWLPGTLPDASFAAVKYARPSSTFCITQSKNGIYMCCDAIACAHAPYATPIIRVHSHSHTFCLARPVRLTAPHSPCLLLCLCPTPASSPRHHYSLYQKTRGPRHRQEAMSGNSVGAAAAAAAAAAADTAAGTAAANRRT